MNMADESAGTPWTLDTKGILAGAIILICGAALFVRMFNPSNIDDKWRESFQTTRGMFDEAGVQCRIYKKEDLDD